MADGFVNLHLHTDFSFLDGAIKVPDLLRRVADFGQTHVATTDHGNLHAVFPLFAKAKDYGITPIAGSELYLAPGARGDKETRTPTWTTPDGKPAGGRPYYHLTVLAQNAAGWSNLSHLSSKSFSEGFYFKPRVDLELLARHSEGLVVLSGCMAGPICQALERGDVEAADKTAKWFAKKFPGRFYIEVQAHDTPGQKEMNHELRKLATRLGLPMVATNDSHFLRPEDHRTQTTLCCLSTGTTLENPTYVYDQGLWVPDAAEMRRRLPDFEDAITNTQVIAESVDFAFKQTYHVPAFPVPNPSPRPEDPAAREAVRLADEAAYLRERTIEGARARYGSPLPKEVEERLEYELGVITTSGYSGYILIVADAIAGAKSMNVPVGPGRGSAAGSLVCYAMGITEVEPLEWGLLFERFLNPDRVSMPDIDVDVGTEGRQAVVQWLRERYGAEAVGQIVTFGTMKARSAIKDAGRALGWAPGDTNRIAALIPNDPNNALTLPQAMEQVPAVIELLADSRHADLFHTAAGLEGLTRQSSVHAGGVIIAPGPLADYAPTMQVKTPSGEMGLAVQCEMIAAEKIGLLKIDILGGKTLDVIQKATGLIHERVMPDGTPDPKAVAFDPTHPDIKDSAAFGLLRRGETRGIFQFESPLATETLRNMQVDRIEDLVAANALLRPGPLDNGMHLEYIERKHGRSPVTLPHPSLDPVLQDTYGIFVYQEQIMQAARTMAGYTLAEADVLRKAVGKKDPVLIAKELGRFITQSVERGICSEAEARTVAGLMETFGRYGFNKSHAVAYSLLSYQTAYLKAHYPAEFYAALMSTYRDDRDYLMSVFAEMAIMDVPILPPDVNKSSVEFSVEKTPDGKMGVRYGLLAIRDVGTDVSGAIVAARNSGGVFSSPEDFLRRVIWSGGGGNRKTLERMAAAGALNGLGATPEQWLAGATKAARPPKVPKSNIAKGQLAMFADLPPLDETPRFVLPDAPVMDPGELLALEHQALGVYVSGHPLNDHRDLLRALNATPIMEVNTTQRSGEFTVAGIVTKVTRRVAQKSGKAFGDVRLEDTTGGIDVRIFPQVWGRVEHLLAKGALLTVTGKHDEKLEGAEDGAREMLANGVEPLDAMVTTGRVAVVVNLPPEGRTPGLMERLQQAVETHAGPAPVLVGVEGQMKRARARMSTNAAALAALRDAVGRDAVRLMVPPPDEEGSTRPTRRGAFRGQGRR